MNILVINAGSSSLKYQLIDMRDESIVAKGLVERIGMADSLHIYKPSSGQPMEYKHDVKDHVEAVELVLQALSHPEHGVVADLSEIGAVGHRVVHGAESFKSSALITDEMLDVVRENTTLAPLHNPANIMGIEACRKVLPNVPMVGVFDTAFHQTMPAKAYIYALPYEIYTEHKVRRYGFHGTSHYFVSQRAAKLMGKPIAQLKIITCHLGNGSSIAAVKYGKCVDTTMGLTPLEGVPMGTRCGDIDPAIVFNLMDKLNMTTAEANDYLNKKSGVLGISGVSSDFRDIYQAADSGNDRAELALQVFAYRVKKTIGAYAAAMDGVDAIVFTAGIGENVSDVRRLVITGMTYLGIDPDWDANERTHAKEAEITKPGSRTRVFVVPTNEELVIARDTYSIVGAGK